MGQQHRSIYTGLFQGTLGSPAVTDDFLKSCAACACQHAAPHSAWASLRLRLFCPKSFLKSALVTTPAGLSYNSFFCPQAAFQCFSICFNCLWQEICGNCLASPNANKIGHHFITYKIVQMCSKIIVCKCVPPFEPPFSSLGDFGTKYLLPAVGTVSKHAATT